MITFLRKKFIKDYLNIENKNVRLAHGILASILGIISNFLVFISKLIIGIISFSISIISDALNNLSDMATSIVALFGFKMAKKKPDKEHPFGHERIEYLSGLVVSIIIIIVGLVLFASSIYKMVTYQNESFSKDLFLINAIILGCSILLKAYQAHIYHHISKLISSISLKANFKDSVNDCLTTSVILIALVIEYILSVNNIVVPFSLDGTLGIMVSGIIIFTGISLLKEEANPLIGTTFNEEYIKKVIEEVKKHKEIINYHDIMCHTYGEAKCYMTIHLEVDKDSKLEEIHDIVDEIEFSLKKKYDIDLTCHLDPVDLNDNELKEVKEKITSYLTNTYCNLSAHDIRLIKRGNKNLVLFEMVTPFDFNDDLTNEISALFNNKYEIQIEVEHPYY